MPGVSTPPLILDGFGFSAGTGYITNPIPFASQQPNPRASYTDGFPPQTVGNTGTPPDVRDFNGILFAATMNIAAFSAGQFWGFQPTVASQNSGYAVGAAVWAADNSGFWLNVTSGNSNNPDTTAAASSGWVPGYQYGATTISGLTNANVTLTAPQAAKEILIISGTLTGNVQIIFPRWNDNWLVQNNCTGAFSVTCKTASGTGVIVPQGITTMIYGDGTNIDLVGSSTSASTGAVANTLALRDSGAGLTAAYFNSTSDRTLKKKIRRIQGALGLLDLFRGVLYQWKATGLEAAGFIAQEFARAVPQGVRRGPDGKLGIDPMAAIAVLTEALREERDARRKLERRIAKLEKR